MSAAGGVLDRGRELVEPDLTEPDPLSMRKVLSRFPTGVTVITGKSSEGPAGMAVNSFTSLSINPPMVLFCPSVTSKTWPVLRSDGQIAVNLLSAEQEEVSRAFAGDAQHRFSEVEWYEAENGCALLKQAMAWLECSIVAEFLAGDHTIVIAHVDKVGVNEEANFPLVFFQSAYHTGIPRKPLRSQGDSQDP
jgi:3-hydroxy-9,10-secoandrosta-1,3,5(10)-triene-9,17-dione monooxygenase reductase component